MFVSVLLFNAVHCQLYIPNCAVVIFKPYGIPVCVGEGEPRQSPQKATGSVRKKEKQGSQDLPAECGRLGSPPQYAECGQERGCLGVTLDGTIQVRDLAGSKIDMIAFSL